MISLYNTGGFELLWFFCLSFSNNGDYMNFPLFSSHRFNVLAFLFHCFIYFFA